jgi:hypothetical protein
VKIRKPHSAAAQARVRLAAGVVVAALAALGVVLVITQSGSDESAAGSAPGECVDRWNRDPGARAFGAHNFSGHGYTRAQVTRLSEVGGAPLGGEDADLCAVIFPASTPDPERIAAGEVYRRGSWVPISELPEVEVDSRTLAELQRRALSAANGALHPDGTISPL